MLIDYSCLRRHGAYWREEACAARLLSGHTCTAASNATCWLEALSGRKAFARRCRPLFLPSKCMAQGNCSSYSQG